MNVFNLYDVTSYLFATETETLTLTLTLTYILTSHMRVNRWKGTQVKGWEDAHVKRCENTQVKGHEGAQVKGCKGVQMKGHLGHIFNLTFKVYEGTRHGHKGSKGVRGKDTGAKCERAQDRVWDMSTRVKDMGAKVQDMGETWCRKFSQFCHLWWNQ